MAIKDFISSPPGTEWLAIKKTVTKDNLGLGYHGWPNDWNPTSPVTYGLAGTWYGAGIYPFGNSDVELMTQYESATWIRSFYPGANIMWEPVTGEAANVTKRFLDMLDFWHAKGKKVLWVSQVFVTGIGRWAGYDQNTAAGEQNVIDFWTDILTSGIDNISTGGLGYTLANHPALSAIEVANESVNATTSTLADAHARATRITKALVVKYRDTPNALTTPIIGLSTVGGNQLYNHGHLNGNPVSIIPVAIDGDDGSTAGRDLLYYADAIAGHWYVFNNKTTTQYAANKANGGMIQTMLNVSNYLECPIDLMQKHTPANAIYGGNYKDIPVWNTESGIEDFETYAVDNPTNPGMRWFRDTYNGRLAMLANYYFLSLFATSDGAGGLGVTFGYVVDISGTSRPSGGTSGISHNGTLGTIVSGTGGNIRVTASSAPTRGWLEYMSIVITAGTSGWADLGLAAGEKKRFITHHVSGNILELLDTTYSAAPAGTQVYTEFQANYFAYPEELKEMSDLFTNNGTSQVVSCGLVRYPNSIGVVYNFEGVGTWYTTAAGEWRKWG